MIDLIAIDREARAAVAAQEAQARKVAHPDSTAPLARDLESAGDLDEFALAMQSPWKRMPKAKKKFVAIGGGVGAAFLIGIAILAGGSGDSSSKAAAVAVATSMPAPPPPQIPPPPAETAVPTPATPPATAPTGTHSMASTSHADHPHHAKAGAPRKKPKSSGPKLQKVQSGGVPPS
jgi:hypothetical protein